MLETIVLIIIVGAAVFYTARSLGKVTGEDGAGCECSSACPMSNSCDMDKNETNPGADPEVSG